MKPLLGVIGGMGPLAAARFFEMLVRRQNPEVEQDYLDILMYSKPSIPDRTAFITGKSQNDPFDALLDAGKVLEAAGVHTIAIPCVTAHFFYEKLAKKIKVPIIHIVQETLKDISARGIKKAGLLATDGTLQAGLFDKWTPAYGIELIKPTIDNQKKLMEMIYMYLKRKQTPQTDVLNIVTDNLMNRGAETVILGCTELGLAVSNMDLHFTDPLYILSNASLSVCEAEI